MKKLDLSPKSRSEAIVKGDKWRFTILTSRLVRIEYSEDGVFEDRATQTVINRAFEVPKFEINENRDDFIKITTEDLEITYTKRPFDKYSFCIKRLCDGGFYYYDDILWGSLPGTAKTLDCKEDDVELEGSILGGWFNVLDDSNSAILNDDMTVSPRDRGGAVDRYIFGYGSEKLLALHDFYKLTGQMPLLPRYAFGNWWSRYYRYTAETYTELMEHFKSENIPFSVAVLDMDWHITKLDPKYGRGWTGYTWDPECFPDPKAFLEYLHKNHLKTTLNLHPAEGVFAYEKPYLEMAKALGIDYENEERISFNITDKKFADAYFKYLHHPLEDEGVDFWWLDWQQGDSTLTSNVSALWMLNHLHYLDNCRNGKRGILMSRYAGPGSHRYPIGFSGDAIISWKALDFQPYFTSTASNIGYSWWSHDIGGHAGGYRDEELQVRWVQLGVFSPIMRLHSSAGPFTRKEPWTYREENGKIISDFLRLRHKMIPYLYTMNYLTHTTARPLVCPMHYFTDKAGEDTRNEYYFGTEMIVSPITQPMDKEIRMGKAVTYLPDGVWYDFFDGREYQGGRKYNIYRGKDKMPVFVKAGGIIPMDGGREEINDVSNPKNLFISVFPGADNTFDMYEDDGETFDFENGKSVFTHFELKWGDCVSFKIKPEGDLSFIPRDRKYKIEFVGIKNAKVSSNEDISVEEGEKGIIVTISPANSGSEITLTLSDIERIKFDGIAAALNMLIKAEMDNMQKCITYDAINKAKTEAEALFAVAESNVNEHIKGALSEYLFAK